MKIMIGYYKNHPIQVIKIERSWARVHTLDGSKLFNKVYAGAGSGMESWGNVFLDRLEDVKEYDVPEPDPFGPGDTHPDPEDEPIPDWLEDQIMYRQLERGEA